MNHIKKNRIILGADTTAVVPFLILMAAVCIMTAGCNTKNGNKTKPKKNLPVVETMVAEAIAMTRNIELTGTIEAARVARMASPAEGPVLDCSIREGDNVKKEQVLLTIGRKRAAEEQVKAARKELAREEEDLQRIEQLVRSGAIPAEQIEESQLRVSRAKSQLTKALESIDDYQIRAPWTGIISKVFVTDGYFVSPRETLLEIFDPKTLIIRFAVPEKELNNVHAGMTLYTTLDTYDNRVFKAKITRLYPELDRKMHTRIVEASLTEDINVVPGMFTRISIPVQVVNDAIMIPDKSIVLTPQGKKVVFVVKGGKAFRHEVRIGIEQNHMVQISEGIQAGDSVVVSGNQKLQDGMNVSVLKQRQLSIPEKKDELTQ